MLNSFFDFIMKSQTSIYTMHNFGGKACFYITVEHSETEK
jgi:hypothetical protein